MNKFFSIKDLEQQPQTKNDKSEALLLQFFSLHNEKIHSVRDLIGRLPVEGEVYFLWTMNSFNAFTFIPFIINQCGVIDELILATYSINIRIIEALDKLLSQGMIQKIAIFISDSIIQRLPRVHDRLCLLSTTYPVKITYAWNHSKIALIHAGDNHFDVEGSGNWSENSQHEQYVFLNSRDVYSFRKNEILNGIDF